MHEVSERLSNLSELKRIGEGATSVERAGPFD